MPHDGGLKPTGVFLRNHEVVFKPPEEDEFHPAADNASGARYTVDPSAVFMSRKFKFYLPAAQQIKFLQWQCLDSADIHPAGVSRLR